LAYPQYVSAQSAKTKPKKSTGELALLQELRRRAATQPSPEIRLGIGDDCALLRLRPGEELAVTTDLSIAGRHFDLDLHPPESVGHRTLARGLSDLAAMGARPVAAFLSLALPRELTVPSSSQRRTNPRDSFSWMSRFLDGLLALARRHKSPLAGGDLAESPLAVADIVLTGAVPRGGALLRSGAQPADLICVTGRLGGSAAAFARLRAIAEKSSRIPGTTKPRKSKHLNLGNGSELQSHLYPEPRIAQGLWLARHRAATAAIDLSDGLSTDLGHLCEESEVAAEVDETLLPVHPGATLHQALNGGEDYELLFTAPASIRLPRSIVGVAVTPIGRIVKRRRGQPDVTLLTARGPQPLAPQGWQHFS